MSGSIAPSSMNGGSSIRGSYNDVRPLSKGEKGKEEEKEEGGIVDLQSEPLPPIYQIPPEILADIFKYVVRPNQPGNIQKLCVLRSVCYLWNKESDRALLKVYWNNLRGSPVPFLHSFTNAVEGRIGSFDFSYFFRFHVLTKSLERIGAPIPKEDPEKQFSLY